MRWRRKTLSGLWGSKGPGHFPGHLAIEREFQEKRGTAIPSSRILGVGGSSHLHLPERVGAGGRGGGLTERGPQEHLQLAPVLVAGQELLLLRMEQPHHVSLRESDVHSHAFRLREPGGWGAVLWPAGLLLLIQEGERRGRRLRPQGSRVL